MEQKLNPSVLLSLISEQYMQIAYLRQALLAAEQKIKDLESNSSDTTVG